MTSGQLPPGTHLWVTMTEPDFPSLIAGDDCLYSMNDDGTLTLVFDWRTTDATD